MKRLLGNIALAALVTLLCLVLAEIGLRAFTPFPIHGRKANKIYDVDVGYRLNPGHPNTDKFGYRNRKDKPHTIAAIGDSHTYGSNVKPEEAWPEVFEQITGEPVYNYGVGSYAVYAHYAHVHRAVEQGAKYVIIALLIHNDFKVNGNSCDIDYAESEFWQDAQERLDLKLPDCSEAKNWQTARAPGFIRYFRGRAQSAILSAMDYLVVRPLSDAWYRLQVKTPSSATQPKPEPKQENKSRLKPGIYPGEKNQPQRPASAYFAGRAIKNQEVEFAFTDLSRQAVLDGIADFEKMLSDMKRLEEEKGVRIALMFIPSKIQLFYEYLDDLDIYEKIPILKDMAINHQKIEKRLIAHMDEIGLTWGTAKPELVTAIEASEKEGSWVFPPSGGHPLPVGYRAYAEAAARLYRTMKSR